MASMLARCGCPGTDRIAIVTGSSSGIGLQAVIELARSGFKVVATLRNLARREPLDQAVAAAGLVDRIDVRRLDITEFDSIPSAIATILRDYGRIDVLVNNAGFALAGFVEDLELQEIQAQFATNFFGQVAMTQAVLPGMRRRRSGAIVMVSSIGGLHGCALISSYCASKHALEGWSESLRLELNPFGIKVVLVEPGVFHSDIWTRNAVLAERIRSGASPNYDSAERLRERVRALRKGNPSAVARVIAKVALDPHPRLRYLVGPDARVELWLKRILPWKWHEKLASKALRALRIEGR